MVIFPYNIHFYPFMVSFFSIYLIVTGLFSNFVFGFGSQQYCYKEFEMEFKISNTQ